MLFLSSAPLPSPFPPVTYKSCAANNTIIEAPPSPSSSSLSVGAIIGIVIGGLAFVAVCVVAAILFQQHKEKKRKEEEARKLAEDIESESVCASVSM